jgi:hypothetical protein
MREGESPPLPFFALLFGKGGRLLIVIVRAAFGERRPLGSIVIHLRKKVAPPSFFTASRDGDIICTSGARRLHFANFRPILPVLNLQEKRKCPVPFDFTAS